MTSLERKFRLEVSKVIEDPDPRARSIKIDHLCSYYKRIGLPESVIDKVIAECKEGGLL